ncbi:unnamed protein product [Brassica oleracea var. botrytis]
MELYFPTKVGLIAMENIWFIGRQKQQPSSSIHPKITTRLLIPIYFPLALEN